MGNPFHRPVLLKETIGLLKIVPGEWYLDATLGGGGHAEAILRAGGKLLGIDCDKEAIEFSRKRLELACPGAFIKIIWGNFAGIGEICQREGLEKFSGILFDLGVSSHQLEAPNRGFSFNRSKILDMRMDSRLGVRAVDLVNGLTEGELYELFNKFGEEKLARPIAQAIGHARSLGPILAADDLAAVVVGVYRRFWKGRSRTHPATRVFQALRIAVNDELNNLKEALPQTATLLRPGGRLAVISFHGLEDGIVKRFLHDKEKEKRLKTITRKPILPSEEEIRVNPSARSGRLRVAEKID